MQKLNFIKALSAGIVLAMASCPQSWAETLTGTCGSSYEACHYTFTDDGVLTIEGNGAIRDNAFSGRYYSYVQQQVKTVVIKKGITSIGNEAFYVNHGMESISIPNTVTSIGNQAFYGVGLEEIEIPKSVTSISSDAFRDSALKDFTIKGENVQIGNAQAFWCSNGKINFNVIEGSDTEKRLKGLMESSRATFNAYIPPKRTYYTIEEAMDHAEKGNNNSITFTFK